MSYQDGIGPNPEEAFSFRPGRCRLLVLGTISVCGPRGLAADNLRPDQGQFRAEVVEMQEGHGSGDQPPEASGNWFPFPPEGAEPDEDDTSPGTSWVPSPAPPPSDQPGYTQPIQPGYGQP